MYLVGRIRCMEIKKKKLKNYSKKIMQNLPKWSTLNFLEYMKAIG